MTNTLVGKVHTTTVNGQLFFYMSDFIARGTFATNTETGEVKQISSGSYISRDLTARKAIAVAFGLESFRK